MQVSLYMLLHCGTEIHDIIIESRKGLLDLFVANALVGIYHKCDMIEESEKPKR